jgi:hypothetical protein
LGMNSFLSMSHSPITPDLDEKFSPKPFLKRGCSVIPRH